MVKAFDILSSFFDHSSKIEFVSSTLTHSWAASGSALATEDSLQCGDIPPNTMGTDRQKSKAILNRIKVNFEVSGRSRMGFYDVEMELP